MTCSAYERDVSACLDYLTGEGIEDLAEVRVTHLRAFLASPHGPDANVGGGVRRRERCGLRNLSGRLAERATGAA
jgi:site-specific recombinase XerD